MSNVPVTTRPARLSDIAFERIAASIVSGEFAPEEQLRVDELAARFGVSRMPVREALLRLEQIGMIEMVASRYTRVTSLTPEVITDAFEYSGSQAGWAARLAAERMDDEELQTALDLLTAIVEGGNAVADQRQLQDAFYVHLIRHARSPYLRMATRDLNVALARAVQSVTVIPDEAQAYLRAAYARVREALSLRDADGVENVIREIHRFYAGYEIQPA